MKCVFLGGVYAPDLRDFRLGYDPNKKIFDKKLTISLNKVKEEIKSFLTIDVKKTERKDNAKSILSAKTKQKIYKILDEKDSSDETLIEIAKECLKATDIGKQLEYSRCLHAEEAAICDASRRGVSLLGTTLYCTTFPCHLCAKHIMAVGIQRVVFIDPFPKSMVKELFPYSINMSKEHFQSGKLNFEPFIGIAPRRFLHLLYRDPELELKDEDGNVIHWPSSNHGIIKHLETRSAANFVFREFSIILSLLTIMKNKKINFTIKESELIKEHSKLIFNALNVLTTTQDPVETLCKNYDDGGTKAFINDILNSIDTRYIK